MITSLLFAIIWLGASQAQHQTGPHPTAPTKLKPDQVVTATRKDFGATVEPVTDMNPFYLQGDFNGDSLSDLAVVVSIERAQADLQKHGAKYVNVDPYSKDNGAQRAPTSIEVHNCLGMAITHGLAAGAGAVPEKYIMYECFSSVKLFGKGQRIRRGSGSQGRTPAPKGDALLLELETGGTALIYWDGKTYKGFGVRGGD